MKGSAIYWTTRKTIWKLEVIKMVGHLFRIWLSSTLPHCRKASKLLKKESIMIGFRKHISVMCHQDVIFCFLSPFISMTYKQEKQKFPKSPLLIWLGAKKLKDLNSRAKSYNKWKGLMRVFGLWEKWLKSWAKAKKLMYHIENRNWQDFSKKA